MQHADNEPSTSNSCQTCYATRKIAMWTNKMFKCTFDPLHGTKTTAAKETPYKAVWQETTWPSTVRLLPRLIHSLYYVTMPTCSSSYYPPIGTNILKLLKMLLYTKGQELHLALHLDGLTQSLYVQSIIKVAVQWVWLATLLVGYTTVYKPTWMLNTQYQCPVNYKLSQCYTVSESCEEHCRITCHTTT